MIHTHLTALLGNVWCMCPTAYKALQAATTDLWRSGYHTTTDVAEFAKRHGIRYGAEDNPDNLPGLMFSSDRKRKKWGKVAVLPLQGMIEPRTTLFGYLMGGTSTESFAAMLDQAVADPDVDSILIDVDSPGGVSYGVQELSDRIYNARSAGKPIVAVANPFAASAAYWIASAAHRLMVVPSGDVGNVGVFAVHLDVSEALEKAGIKETVIRSVEHKAEFIDSEPLKPESRDFLQSQVDATHKQFVTDVARNRGVSVDQVQEQFGKGRSLMAKDAMKAGMVDRVTTFEDVASKLSAGRIRVDAGSHERMVADDDWSPVTMLDADPDDSAELDAARLSQLRRSLETRRQFQP